MGGALPNYQQYWGIVTRDPNTGHLASQRLEKHAETIRKAVEEAMTAEEKKQKVLVHEEL